MTHSTLFSPAGSEPLRGCNILVAEDDLAQVIATSLERAGAAVATASDGLAALKSLDASRFDIVVLNYRMPRLNGAEVLRAMRECDDTTPVIFVSAWERDEIPERIDDLPFDDWIEKPFSMRVLLSRIETVIALHRNRAGASP
jgi:DNA-binding response OmpR family regulator